MECHKKKSECGLDSFADIVSQKTKVLIVSPFVPTKTTQADL